jgi:hypothetical protein
VLPFSYQSGLNYQSLACNGVHQLSLPVVMLIFKHRTLQLPIPQTSVHLG